MEDIIEEMPSGGEALKRKRDDTDKENITADPQAPVEDEPMVLKPRLEKAEAEAVGSETKPPTEDSGEGAGHSNDSILGLGVDDIQEKIDSKLDATNGEHFTANVDEALKRKRDDIDKENGTHGLQAPMEGEPVVSKPRLEKAEAVESETKPPLEDSGEGAGHNDDSIMGEGLGEDHKKIESKVDVTDEEHVTANVEEKKEQGIAQESEDSAVLGKNTGSEGTEDHGSAMASNKSEESVVEDIDGETKIKQITDDLGAGKLPEVEDVEAKKKPDSERPIEIVNSTGEKDIDKKCGSEKRTRKKCDEVPEKTGADTGVETKSVQSEDKELEGVIGTTEVPVAEDSTEKDAEIKEEPLKSTVEDTQESSRKVDTDEAMAVEGSTKKKEPQGTGESIQLEHTEAKNASDEAVEVLNMVVDSKAEAGSVQEEEPGTSSGSVELQTQYGSVKKLDSEEAVPVSKAYVDEVTTGAEGSQEERETSKAREILAVYDLMEEADTKEVARVAVDDASALERSSQKTEPEVGREPIELRAADDSMEGAQVNKAEGDESTKEAHRLQEKEPESTELLEIQAEDSLMEKDAGKENKAEVDEITTDVEALQDEEPRSNVESMTTGKAIENEDSEPNAEYEKSSKGHTDIYSEETSVQEPILVEASVREPQGSEESIVVEYSRATDDTEAGAQVEEIEAKVEGNQEQETGKIEELIETVVGGDLVEKDSKHDAEPAKASENALQKEGAEEPVEALAGEVSMEDSKHEAEPSKITEEALQEKGSGNTIDAKKLMAVEDTTENKAEAVKSNEEKSETAANERSMIEEPVKEETEEIEERMELENSTAKKEPEEVAEVEKDTEDAPEEPDEKTLLKQSSGDAELENAAQSGTDKGRELEVLESQWEEKGEEKEEEPEEKEEEETVDESSEEKSETVTNKEVSLPSTLKKKSGRRPGKKSVAQTAAGKQKSQKQPHRNPERLELLKKMSTADDMKKLLAEHGRSEKDFTVNDVIQVDDLMQTNYDYKLEAPVGKDFAEGFYPRFSPKEMLELGIFEGKVINDCIFEFPKEWYQGALEKEKLCPQGPDDSVNQFKVNSRLGKESRKKGRIPRKDPHGWFQWYCRYYLGRRLEPDDSNQMSRWRQMRRHAGQIKKYCEPGDLSCRAKQRQNLLNWSHDCFM